MLRSRAAKAFILTMLVVGLFYAVVAVASLRNRNRAQHLLSDIQEPRWATATFEDAKNLAAKYGGGPGGFGTSRACTSSHCRFDIGIVNSHLWRLHLAPRTVFAVSIFVENNRVTRITTAFWSERKEKGQVLICGADVENDFGFPRYKGQQPYSSAVHFERTMPQPARLIVNLTPASTDSQKHSAYQFNFACLTKFGGCSQAGDFLPGVQPD